MVVGQGIHKDSARKTTTTTSKTTATATTTTTPKTPTKIGMDY
jgi:hypothetical protein